MCLYIHIYIYIYIYICIYECVYVNILKRPTHSLFSINKLGKKTHFNYLKSFKSMRKATEKI